MKNINENVIDKMKKIVKDKQAMKIDGVLVDLYTASAVTQIYDKVNPANKKKMENMSPQGLATAAFKILGKKESVSEDASGMNPKQKMKFDQLMKKLDGGKEHMKFKRMAKNSVQGDDMFHGYVKDLAMEEQTLFLHARYLAMKEQAEIVEYTTVSPEMAKVFDSLKVGDKLAYKTKRYSSDGHKVTKKKMLRHNQLGWEQITLGKGVYLLKKEKTKEVLMKSGNMPVTIIDLVKESMNETVQVNEVQGSDYDFSPIQLSRLKKAYSTVKRIDPSSQNYKKLKKAISKLHPNTLEKIAREKIRFVSVIAAGEYEKKSGKRLHARDYMWFVESTELEESVKISFHSKGAKTKWMKKQGVASKEILNQTPTSVELPSRWKDLSKKKDHDEIFSVVNEAPKPFGRVGQPIPKPSQVRSAISRVKKQLMKKYKQKGGYENFGQKELEKMKTQFNYNPSGEPDEREIAKMLRAFDDWAMDYDGDMREGIIEKAMTLGGTNKTGGEIFMGDKGIQNMVALSKKNPNIAYTVKSDNYGEFKPHWLKNGKFAKRTVANINFDMDKNAVRGVPKGKTVKSTIFVLRYSVNEGVQMENDEYDNEGGMALSQLRTAKSAVEDLMSSIKEMDNLPEWVQSKLTKAVDYMDSVRDYMASEEGEEPVNEGDLSKMQSADTVARKKSRDMNIKKNRVSDNKEREIYRLQKQKQSAERGSGIKKDSPEMKKLNKTYVNKVQKIMQEENIDESMARARADARRHMGGRGAQRGMAPLKKDSDISASDADRKAANKNIIMQIRKAADLPNGAEVEFPSGKKKLDRNTAQQLLTKFGSLRRSSEKDNFQKSIKSLSDVKKLIGR